MGKVSGAGMPPASDTMPGCDTTFRISRMTFLRIPSARLLNKCSNDVVTAPPPYTKKPTKGLAHPSAFVLQETEL